MHIEFYTIRVVLIEKKQKVKVRLCFEVEDTEADRKKLVQEIEKQVAEEVYFLPHRICGYTTRIIYPKEK